MENKGQPDYKQQRERLISALISEGLLRTPRVIEGIKRVPRELFVPENLRPYAYNDAPLPTAQGQTISAPHVPKKDGRDMVAIMNEALELMPGQKVLEIGAGTGYHAATIAETIGPAGRVYAVERVESLVRFARENLQRAGYSDRVIIIHGDGSLGYPERAPYDRILVTAAAPRIPPKLLEQLKPEGVLVIPIGSRVFGQELVRVRKKGEKPTKEFLGGVAFVPLIGEQGHES